MNARGFTLIELLVAIAVLVVLAAMAFVALNTMIAQYHDANDEVERLGAMQRTMMLLSTDLLQMQPRSVREEFHGDRVPAVIGGPDHDYALEFTRGGWSNPGQRRRATLQRTAWRLDDDRIERLHWAVLDRAQQQEPVVTPLVSGVARFEWRFMDRAREWHDAWPPRDATQRPDELPGAAELTIVLDNGAEIRRVFALRAY